MKQKLMTLAIVFATGAAYAFPARNLSSEETVAIDTTEEVVNVTQEVAQDVVQQNVRARR